jgi:hypothetical protein
MSSVQGIEGHGFYGNCIVPIIENTARECELTDRLRQAIIDYPQANAVLVRRHGRWGGGVGGVQGMHSCFAKLGGYLKVLQRTRAESQPVMSIRQD